MVGVGIVEFLIAMIATVAIPLFLLFFIIKWAVGGAIKDSRASSGPEVRTAREILDERYAKGEIGREEYEAMRRDIEA